ncbi:MAG: 50S ribosomal protein L17 [Candidatus Liptonbacteria bacterium CG11_big_fil_rev_8_21_14_0_20_35_14]|uniref:50S ribosomal protein L17 n=1 Tax=Candidatus Liptonbacteria bacterium CG11_big_fil_rev_8_21_14_0_20_35_14 TaxID=1974634 RepID=A0A2H0N7F9_9BACT|nr:MAG: 50S ribosomal protein L17 [Candidatus Liptonbacteria bacterium CG11_big_fil_rev_8_21_14_0_20_35_14]
MNKGKVGRKFGLKRGERQAFIKGLANNLIRKEKIETTEARARELRPKVEKMITTAKKQTLASFRKLLANLNKTTAEKLYFDIAKRYTERKGGYTKITKLDKVTKRDGGKRAIIEFVK